MWASLLRYPLDICSRLGFQVSSQASGRAGRCARDSPTVGWWVVSRIRSRKRSVKARTCWLKQAFDYEIMSTMRMVSWLAAGDDERGRGWSDMDLWVGAKASTRCPAFVPALVHPFKCRAQDQVDDSVESTFAGESRSRTDRSLASIRVITDMILLMTCRCPGSQILHNIRPRASCRPYCNCWGQQA
jgi:hypothetical protein